MIQFEVENIYGVITITPKSLVIRKHIGYVRCISSRMDIKNEIPFKYNGEEYRPVTIHAYNTTPIHYADFVCTDGLLEKERCKLYIEDINLFTFDKLPYGEKLTVMMFEYKPTPLHKYDAPIIKLNKDENKENKS